MPATAFRALIAPALAVPQRAMPTTASLYERAMPATAFRALIAPVLAVPQRATPTIASLYERAMPATESLNNSHTNHKNTPPQTSDINCRIAVLQLQPVKVSKENPMPVRPRPFNLRCPICDWTKHCRPSSDCYSPLEVPIRCKRCGCTDLEGEYGTNLRLKAFLRTQLGM